MMIKLRVQLFFLLACLVLIPYAASAQDTQSIRVQFLYGSKPLKKYKSSERKWFGGMAGGHTGIQIDSNSFLSFEGTGRFHPINHRRTKHSSYKILNAQAFWDIMGTPGDEVKKATITIPVTGAQKKLL